MYRSMTLTVYANGITIDEPLASIRVFEYTHMQDALQYIFDTCCDDDIANAQIKLDGNCCRLNKAQHHSAKQSVIPQHKCVQRIRIECCNNGTILTNESFPDCAQVYESKNIINMLQYLANCCFPGMKVSI